MFKKVLEFDEDLQKLKVKKVESSFDTESNQWIETKLDLPEELTDFVTDSGEDEFFGIFDSTKYFLTFIHLFYNIIKSGKLLLPKGLQLSTDFQPCKVCMIEEFERPIYVRCHHDSDCEEHAKTRENPNYNETCNCRPFSPQSCRIH